MAFAATVVWEVRTTGSDNNGGGFDGVSGTPGTDFSQQTAAQISYTDLVIDGTTNTKCTSAGNPFTSAHVGNIINITSGTGFTVQRVQVLSVAAGVATCDKSLGTLSSTGGHGNLGGCLATVGTAATLVVAGNITYIAATGTYLSVATFNLNVSGSSGLPISWVGYTSTRTDHGQVTLKQNGGGVACITASGGFQRFYNIISDDNSQVTSAWSCNNQNVISWFNCKAINAATGFSIAANEMTFVNCVASACSNDGWFLNSSNGLLLFGCRATANTSSGFEDTSCIGVEYINCISDNNTGASSDGFRRSSGNVGCFISCVAYKNGRDGFRIGAGELDLLTMYSCISYGHTAVGAVGIRSLTNWTINNLSTLPFVDFNAVGNNTANYSGISAGAHDVTLTADPFTNGASNDFSLNNTAGGGAACRAAGFPGVLQSGGTGHIDMGALQHADPVASGMLFIPNMEAT